MDIDKKRALQRERTKRYRNRQKGVTSESVTPSVTQPQTIADVKTLTPAEARAEDKAILKAWADGKGTEYQRRLGVLAQHYG